MANALSGPTIEKNLCDCCRKQNENPADPLGRETYVAKKVKQECIWLALSSLTFASLAFMFGVTFGLLTPNMDICV
jgi:hypothetical protein